MKQGRGAVGHPPSRAARGNPGERGGEARTAEGLRKPEGGTGEGLATLASRGRRSRRPWQHGGTRSASVVGAKNPRRGDTRSAGESRWENGESRIGRYTTAVL